MPVYDSKVQPLMQQFMAAGETEGAATKVLLAFMQSGSKDENKLKELTDNMTSAHDNKMKIYAEMQKYRLDKSTP